MWTNGPRKEYAALERSVGGHRENPRSSLTSLTKTQCLIEYPQVFKLQFYFSDAYFKDVKTPQTLTDGFWNFQSKIPVWDYYQTLVVLGVILTDGLFSSQILFYLF